MLKKIEDLKQNLNSVILGKENVVELIIVSTLSGGHVLMDDVPGGRCSLRRSKQKIIKQN